MTDQPDDDRPNLDRIPPRRGNPGHGGAHGHGERENGALRANRALELRMAGASYQQIADALGFTNRGTAFRSVAKALRDDTDRNSEQRDQYRALQLARCERLIRAHWPQALQGNLGSTEQIRRLLEREARMLGLDAPVQVQVSEDQRARLHALLDGLEQDLIRAAEKPTWQPGGTDDAP